MNKTMQDIVFVFDVQCKMWVLKQNQLRTTAPPMILILHHQENALQLHCMLFMYVMYLLVN